MRLGHSQLHFFFFAGGGGDTHLEHIFYFVLIVYGDQKRIYPLVMDIHNLIMDIHNSRQ